MSKHRVLLACSEHLFGESVETILRAEGDMELIGPWSFGDEICQRIPGASPNVVLIVDVDSQSEAGANLAAAIMEKFPSLPIIRMGLTENMVRVYSTNILPARRTDLIETIRNLPAAGISSSERSDKK